MKKQLIGELQRHGGPPEAVTIVTDDRDPLVYKNRHLGTSSVSGVITLNLDEAPSWDCTLTENVTSIDVNGSFVADEMWEFHLELVQDSTPRTVTWPAAFEFPGGTDHVMSTGSGDVDAIRGYSIDGGTTWKCTFVNAFS